MTCIICHKETDKVYNYDAGTSIFPYCDEHSFDVFYFITLLNADGNLSPQNWLSHARKQYQRKLETNNDAGQTH